MGWFLNPSFDRDIHFFGATMAQGIIKLKVADDTIVHSVSHTSPGDIDCGLVEVEGMQRLITFSRNLKFNAYDQNLNL